MVIETRQNETHREKILKTQDFSELWDNVSSQIASLNKVKKKKANNIEGKKDNCLQTIRLCKKFYESTKKKKALKLTSEFSQKVDYNLNT